MIQQAHAKDVIAEGRKLWRVDLPDRIAYLHYRDDGSLDGFTLRKSDALNKRLKELVK